MKPLIAGTITIFTDLGFFPALQTIGKMKKTLEGRAIGILIAEDSDGVFCE